MRCVIVKAINQIYTVHTEKCNTFASIDRSSVPRECWETNSSSSSSTLLSAIDCAFSGGNTEADGVSGETLTKPLHFEWTRLVCEVSRVAIPDMTKRHAVLTCFNWYVRRCGAGFVAPGLLGGGQQQFHECVQSGPVHNVAVCGPVIRDDTTTLTADFVVVVRNSTIARIASKV